MAEPEPPPLNPTAQEFTPTYVYYPLPPPEYPPPPPVTAFLILTPTPPTSSLLPTRALLLTSVPTTTSESTLRRDLEVFGHVRAVQMERIQNGIVTVHFYDLRQATNALNQIQRQQMQQQHRLRRHFDGLTSSPAPGLICGKAIWAQFAFPLSAGIPDRYNQGTVTVTVDSRSNVSPNVVKDVFQAFGDVKGILEIPFKKNQKLVEFYDTRDASKAVAAVNGREINGKKVVVEFSRPTGHKCYTPTEVLQPPPPCRKGSPVECGLFREGSNVNSHSVKKNVKNLYKNQQSPEKWAGGGGGGGRNKQWKGQRFSREKCDERFLIKDEKSVVSSFQDSRTTVMIKNIPNKYSQKLLVNMLDNHCMECKEGGNQASSSYDFVYLPIDFVNKCNVGYGFVNMTSPEATHRLYKAFHHQNWEVFNSKKICEVSYARLQGLEALKEHFKKSKFPQEAEEYMPVVFTPPRDGQTVTEPVPIVGSSSIASSQVLLLQQPNDLKHTSTSDDDDDDDDINSNSNLGEESEATGSVGGGDETE